MSPSLFLARASAAWEGFLHQQPLGELEGFLHRGRKVGWGCRGPCFLPPTYHTAFLFPQPGCQLFEGRDCILSLHLLVQVLRLQIAGTRFILSKLMNSIIVQIHIWASANQALVPMHQLWYVLSHLRNAASSHDLHNSPDSSSSLHLGPPPSGSRQPCSLIPHPHPTPAMGTSHVLSSWATLKPFSFSGQSCVCAFAWGISPTWNPHKEGAGRVCLIHLK